MSQVIGNRGLLRRKTRILITKEPRFLQHTDYILVMKNHSIVDSGTFEELNARQVHSNTIIPNPETSLLTFIHLFNLVFFLGSLKNCLICIVFQAITDCILEDDGGVDDIDMSSGSVGGTPDHRNKLKEQRIAKRLRRMDSTEKYMLQKQLSGGGGGTGGNGDTGYFDFDLPYSGSPTMTR